MTTHLIKKMHQPMIDIMSKISKMCRLPGIASIFGCAEM